ncbi:MAG: four helix bundle protein, partial [Chlorobiaceae bacterium]|nr:four helix bundle protein [Chlorobiaceae bacterium]
KELDVWKQSMSFVEGIYALTRCFPDEEKFGLSSQLRRASVSIPSNISEGAARQGKKEFEHFLYIALGSAAEVETQLELVCRLGFASESIVSIEQENLRRIRQMLLGMIRHLKRADT